MNLTLNEAHQREMRLAYLDGAPGILVSGLVWIAAAVLCHIVDVTQGVWTLLVGGALIYPIGLLVGKLLGASVSIDKSNALNPLAMASTIWLILCCAMAYGLYTLNPVLFFPAMLASIGCRYLIFASIYARSIYWVLGGCLIAASQLALFASISPGLASGLGGMIEIIFAVWIFFRTANQTSPQ
jgi:hypothetical protein